jgi:NAD(P) transhydrogenase
MKRYDVIVIGAGPAGERAAIYAARVGKDVAIIERHHVVGGARVNWGTIPSKTLRESARLVQQLGRDRLLGLRCRLDGPLTISDLMHHERQVVQRELELVNQALDRNRIEVFEGAGRFVDPHTVAIIGHDGTARARLQADRVVIAVGTSPDRPEHVPFDAQRVVDSDGVLGLDHIPRSLIVLGAGVIGVEYACIFAALGVEVTLVDTRPRLLPYLDREIADILEREMRRAGMIVLHDERPALVERRGGAGARVRCVTQAGNELEAEALLYSIGRNGNTADLGLETIRVQPDERGLLRVGEHYQTSHPHIYAVGDVIGYPALASTSMEQGRRAMRHAFGLSGPQGDDDHLPFAVYAIPEVSYTGDDEAALARDGVEAIVGRGRYALNPRGQIMGETGGLLKLVFEAPSLKLRGVHAVGDGASELIHTGQAYLRMGASAHDIADGLFNYPTLSDLYRHAALEALALAARRRGATPPTALDDDLAPPRA